ncbi:MAG: hypothetical protein ACYCPT_12290 [Acidimicrobiales bacterium]
MMATSVKSNEVFELISSYIVNTFYNDLYGKSKQKVDTMSITDAYKDLVQQYKKSYKKFYIHIIKKMHEYFQKFSNKYLHFKIFEGSIVREFILPEYYNNFSEKNKDEYLNAIISELLTKFIVFVMYPEALSMIIDKRSALQAQILQDEIIKLCEDMKHRYSLSFVNKKHHRGDKSSKNVINMLLRYAKLLAEENAKLRKEIKHNTQPNRRANMVVPKIEEEEEIEFDVQKNDETIDEEVNMNDMNENVLNYFSTAI